MPRDRPRAPPLALQTNDRQPALDGIWDRRVALVAPRRVKGQRLGHEHLPHRLVVDRAAKSTAADPGDLPQAKRRILGLQRDDGAADLGGQPPTIALGQRSRIVEEALHPRAGEPSGLAAQRAFRDAGLPGAIRSRLAEEHDGPQELVGFLLG
jgi:hypothetical protein